MQMAFFAVPARGDSGLQESLNAFLRSHRVLTVHREFVGQGDNSFWALAVEKPVGCPVKAPAARSWTAWGALANPTCSLEQRRS